MMVWVLHVHIVHIIHVVHAHAHVHVHIHAHVSMIRRWRSIAPFIVRRDWSIHTAARIAGASLVHLAAVCIIIGRRVRWTVSVRHVVHCFAWSVVGDHTWGLSPGVFIVWKHFIITYYYYYLLVIQ
jgi:hypothetical protein